LKKYFGILIAVIAVGAVAWMALQKDRQALVSESGEESRAPSAASDGGPHLKDPPKFELRALADRRALRELLQKRRYEQLEATLESYRKEFEANPLDERRYVDAYRAFDFESPGLRDQIVEWVEARQESDAAHAALAYHYEDVGWERRGTGWAKDTTGTRTEDMWHFFELAEREARRALELQPRQLIAYDVLINMSKATARTGDRPRVIDEALATFPASFYLRRTAIFGMQPRWGGSYRAIAEFARAAEPYSEQNPRLKVLLGYADWAEGKDAYTAERYETALKLYDQALAYGIDSQYLKDRIQALEKLDRYEEALRDAETLQAQFPDEKEAPVQDVMKDFRQHAIQLHSDNKFLEAIDAYSRVLKLVPEDAEILFWRGNAFQKMQRAEEALADFQHVVRLQPTKFEAVARVVNALTVLGRLDEILPVWDAYIARVPDKADAYFERGRAHNHFRRHTEALADVTKACELGKPEGCALKQRLGGG
jgi:tetratricopeptide (TPR) repeat protein